MRWMELCSNGTCIFGAPRTCAIRAIRDGSWQLDVVWLLSTVMFLVSCDDMRPADSTRCPESTGRHLFASTHEQRCTGGRMARTISRSSMRRSSPREVLKSHRPAAARRQRGRRRLARGWVRNARIVRLSWCPRGGTPCRRNRREPAGDNRRAPARATDVLADVPDGLVGTPVPRSLSGSEAGADRAGAAVKGRTRGSRQLRYRRPAGICSQQVPRRNRELVLLASAPARVSASGAGATQGWYAYVGDGGPAIGIDYFGGCLVPGEVVDWRSFWFMPAYVVRRALWPVLQNVRA